MAKCPKCHNEAEPRGFDDEVEMRLAYCAKCDYTFYETGLMFTFNTTLKNPSKKNGLKVKDDLTYNDCLQGISYENEMRLHWLTNFLDLGHDSTVLDTGCGYGNLPLLFAKEYGAKRAVGLDVNPEYVQIARRKAQKLGLKNVQFDCASIYDMPYSDKEFSHLVCAEALEHLSHPIDALKEMRRVTSSVLVIQMPVPNPLLLMSVGKAYELISKQTVYHAKNPKVVQSGETVYPLHVFEPSALEFLSCLRSAGWKVENFVGTRLFPIPLSFINQELAKEALTTFMKICDYKLSKLWPIKLMANQVIVKARPL